MRGIMALAAAAAALSGGQAHAAAVEIKDAVVRVTVIPEDRADIQVVVLARNARLPITVKTGKRTIVDGGLRSNRIRGCRVENGRALVRIQGVGDIPLAAMPQIAIHTPRDVDLSAGGAVFGAIGRAASVSLGAAGCGDWTIANVERELRVNMAGSGDARAGGAGSAKLRVAGAGDVTTGEVRGPVAVDVAGSGDVKVRSVAGPLDVHVAGSGDVTVAGGRAPSMTASVAGSGNVVFRGVADRLEARIAGSGDVRARQVRGPVKKAVMGSGSVTIG